MSAENPKAPPVSDTDMASPAWQGFFRDIQKRLAATTEIPWASLSFTGSNLTDLLTRNHEDLQNINTATYTHLSATNHTDLTDGGVTSLHQHNAADVVGTATNDNATAGDIGEYVTSEVASTTVSLTTNTAANVTSISLTAGDWDVYGLVQYDTAAGTSVTSLQSGVSSTSATQSAYKWVRDTFAAYVPGAGVAFAQGIPPTRFSLASTTTIYLVGLAIFTVSTMTAGGRISARRAR